MLKFLLDANLSPVTADHLIKLGFDTKSITREGQGELSDKDIVKLAKNENRIIVTFDLDFGEIYHQTEKGNVGIIVLRLRDQTIESVNSELDKFVENEINKLKNKPDSLVVVKEGLIRFII